MKNFNLEFIENINGQSIILQYYFEKTAPKIENSINLIYF